MTQRPNVVIITTHDTGRHFGCYGQPTLNTPAIDQLASEGVRLSNYFTAVPICSASRVSMLTGQYPQTHGQYDLPLWGYEFHDHVRHLSHRMKDAGYHTALIGVQHETKNLERLCFDHITPPKSDGQFATALDLAQATRQYLEKADRSEPFYLQIGFKETHSPFTFGGVPADHSRGVYVPPYIKPTGPAYELMGQLQGAIRRVDQAVGIIDQALRDNNLAENTLFIFTTDHGMELPRAKWHLLDGGIEIGLVARWPKGGVTGGRVCDALSNNVDFTPTLLELIGVPGDDSIQGVSMAAQWRGESADPIHEHIFGYYLKSDSRCIRTNTEKLIIQGIITTLPRVPVDLCDPARNHPAPKLALYDLVNDPLETRNLADEPAHAKRRDELLAHLWQWMEDQRDPLLQGSWPSPAHAQALAPYHAWKQASQTVNRS